MSKWCWSAALLMVAMGVAPSSIGLAKPPDLPADNDVRCQDARDGDDVVLTVDSALQAIVERELDEAVKKYKPDMATVVMMRPSTGEILAMASRPDFDPNDFHSAEPEQMKNRAVLDMVEPGSTFKIVAVAAALNEKRV